MPSITQIATLLTASRARKREQWLSPNELRRLRATRLQRLAAAAARTGYYGRLFREAGIEPTGLTDEQQLRRLPVLEKVTLHKTSESGLLAEPVERLSPVTTSGSTGQPVQVFRSVRDQAQVSALWARVLHAFGHRVFDTQVNLNLGRAVARTGPVALLRQLGLLPEIRHISVFEPVDRQIEILRELHPHTLSSYAMSLEAIADAVLERGITDLRPKVVFSAAMALSDRGRAIATDAFGVAPLDVYVSVEMGPLGWECPQERGALHLNDDMQIVEILDQRDQPVAEGEIGQVVVTQLGCLAQPLLRYRLGDLAARIPGHCGCGRGLARLSRVQGRTRHVIRTPDGRVLYSMMLGATMKQFPEVRHWQVRQTAADALSVLVVPSATWQPAAAKEIARQLAEKFAPGLHFTVAPVESIPLAPSGKHQTIVPLEDASAAATS